jgi:hypothetical protein
LIKLADQSSNGSYCSGGLSSRFFVPRGLSRLSSAADSAAPRVVSAALLVVDQVVRSVAGRAAVETLAVRESFPPAAEPLAAWPFPLPPAAQFLLSLFCTAY